MGEANLNSEESWCTTQIRTIPISFTWTIKNVSFILKVGDEDSEEDSDKLKSSYFSSDCASNNVKWSATKTPIFAKYCLRILGKRKKHRVYIAEQETPIEFHKSKERSHIVLNQILDLVEDTFLPHDTLKLFCKITFTDSIVEMNSGKVLNVELSNHQLSHDFEELLKNQSMSDVKLVVNGETFNAHKLILAARSPIFAAMFSHEVLVENEKAEVVILGVDKDVFREVLQFIYTGKTEKLKDIARDVLPVADKYDLQGLKEECEVVLFDTLSVKNTAELLTFAYFHNATQLKARILDFIRWNSGAVLKSRGWRKLISRNSDLMNDVIVLFSNNIIK